jgi:hypothetical protein
MEMGWCFDPFQSEVDLNDAHGNGVSFRFIPSIKQVKLNGNKFNSSLSVRFGEKKSSTRDRLGYRPEFDKGFPVGSFRDS